MVRDNIAKAKAEIAQAASDATKIIAQAALDAGKVVSVATAEAVRVREEKGAGDHDLLVELKVKMEDLKTDIADLKDGSERRISNLEIGKVNIKDSYPTLYKIGVDEKLKDHEDRLRTIEDNILKWMGAIGVITFAITFIVGYLLKFIK